MAVSESGIAPNKGTARQKRAQEQPSKKKEAAEKVEQVGLEPTHHVTLRLQANGAVPSQLDHTDLENSAANRRAAAPIFRRSLREEPGEAASISDILPLSSCPEVAETKKKLTAP